MNTPQSMALGWGSLIAAAGVSFYYAKKSIDERRKLQEAAGTRPPEKLDWKARIEAEARKTAAAAASENASAKPSTNPSPPVSGDGKTS